MIEVMPDRDTDGRVLYTFKPFASKKLENGQSLFKRVHGSLSTSIPDGQTVNIDFVVPYTATKFTGAEIFNTSFGDIVNFKVLDDANGTYSQIPYYKLNQFGFNVIMPNGTYKNSSDYDADIFLGMVLRCEYTNNSGAAKVVGMNLELHEVK